MKTAGRGLLEPVWLCTPIIPTSLVDLLFTGDREVDREEEEDEERENRKYRLYIYNRTKSKLYESVPYRLSP